MIIIILSLLVFLLLLSVYLFVCCSEFVWLLFLNTNLNFNESPPKKGKKKGIEMHQSQNKHKKTVLNYTKFKNQV